MADEPLIAGSIVRATPAERPGAVEVRVPIALGDPRPLGLVAFALSALSMGAILAGWWADPGAQLALVLPLVTAFGVTQFVAGLWSLRCGQTLTATFFGTFGAFSGAVGTYQLAAVHAAAGPVVAEGIATTALGPFGVVLGGLCFVALFVAVGSMASNTGLSAASLALAVALFCLAWASFAGGDALLGATAGWAGMVAGGLALVTAAMLSVGGRASRLLLATAPPWRLPRWRLPVPRLPRLRLPRPRLRALRLPFWRRRRRGDDGVLRPPRRRRWGFRRNRARPG